MRTRMAEEYPESLWAAYSRCRSPYRFDVETVEDGEVGLQLRLPRDVWAMLDADSRRWEEDWTMFLWPMGRGRG